LKEQDAAILALRRDADALAHALPPLLMATRRTARATAHGSHGRRRTGPGEDFWQYRPYAPGDSAQAIDWRKSARGERVLVRETEWMAANTLWIWVQTDAGMHERSHMATTSKLQRAALLALAVARMVTRAGERVAPLGAPFRPDHTARALERLARWFNPAEPARVEDVPPVTDVPRFSSCLLIGDFFADPERLEERVRRLAARGASGHLLQVVDPAEETFPFRGRTLFEDTGGEARLLVGRAEELRAAYRERLAAYRARLRGLARRLGWTFAVHRTDASPATALLALRARLEAGVAKGPWPEHAATGG
jgi:uncharacterized protein (DUF58 family)